MVPVLKHVGCSLLVLQVIRGEILVHGQGIDLVSVCFCLDPLLYIFNQLCFMVMLINLFVICEWWVFLHLLAILAIVDRLIKVGVDDFQGLLQPHLLLDFEDGCPVNGLEHPQLFVALVLHRVKWLARGVLEQPEKLRWMAWDDGDGAVGDHGKWRVHSHKEGFVSKEQGVMQRTLALKE